MLTHFSESTAYRSQLVTTLQQSGAIRSATVAQAFATIPRERFVPTFYEQKGRSWIPRNITRQGEQWLAQIYEDQSLVTHLNTQNVPISSSSKPSVMAAMLEALDIQPGMRVLEIGTGTGYNAALLARLTGDPSLVTTIELDAEVAQQAKSTLCEIVGPIRVEVGDGNMGVCDSTPYDRIIATASNSVLPHAWFEQLSLDGCLIMPLQGSLQVGGFLVIQKDGEGANGHFRQPSLYFMAMRSPSEEATTTHNLFQQPITEEIRVEADDPVLPALNEEKFRWFIQWWWPTDGSVQINTMKLPDGKRAYLFKDFMQMTILQLTQRADGCWYGNQRGNFPLWTMTQKAYSLFCNLGKPGQEAFHVSIKNQQASLSISTSRNVIYLRDIYSQ